VSKPSAQTDETSFARVIVDLALDREFDYRVPPALTGQVKIGSQVLVPFGRRTTIGYVVDVAGHSEYHEPKDILRVVGERPLITERVVKLARWMADYYVAPLEQAVRTLLPGVVRRSGGRFKEALHVFAGDLDHAESQVRRGSKQEAVLRILKEQPVMLVSEMLRAAVATRAVLRAMEKKGWLKLEKRPVQRNPADGHHVLRTDPLPLMPQQADALKLICTAIDTGKPPVVLLFGVTGSGKTEVYMQAMQYVLDAGKSAIMLVPEISLTPQTVERFRARFGDVIAVLHSHLSEGERHDEWHRLQKKEARIAIGARSALFAPVEPLGLIIVDEEHEYSYKQEEAPRYNARDVAVVRGHMESCPVVLGSATPALESLQNAAKGKYAMVRMPHRVDHRRMPVLRIIDMRMEAEKEGRLNVLSRDLMEAIRQRLERKEQTILFLNRRGYATSLICPSCGYVAQCRHCSVAMTYHKAAHELRCHICGDVRKVPDQCPKKECGDPAFKYAGLGTQRVESVVAGLFPKAAVQRMDADTTTRKESYEEILGAFRRGDIDILLGTQMIAKGLDYPNVTLVGVINADTSLHLPDFRAGERTFQLLTQVAGRAGRGDVAGEVLVQTFTPFHAAIQAARRLDYDGFFDQEVEFRRQLFYPPFSHLLCLTLRGPEEKDVIHAGTALMKQLEPMWAKTDVRAAGPIPAPIARMKGLFRYQIMARAARTSTMTTPLREALKTFRWPRKVKYAIDVDALSLL